MAYSHYNFFKGVLLLIKYSMLSLGMGTGIYLLSAFSSADTGFKFLGVLLLLIGIMMLILFCIDCATIDNAEEVFIAESLCCGGPLYLLIAALGIFALAVSSNGTGKSIPGLAYKEYHLGAYSEWMQNKVNDTHNWEKHYKRTLIKHRVCSDMTTKYGHDTLDKFHKRSLNSFESGCCKPPEECKLNYTSPTVWEKPENQKHYNEDCSTWSNEQTTLCFNCQSCKAAFAQDVTERWFYVSLLIVIVIAKQVLLLLGYTLYCCNNDGS